MSIFNLFKNRKTKKQRFQEGRELGKKDATKYKIPTIKKLLTEKRTTPLPDRFHTIEFTQGYNAGFKSEMNKRKKSNSTKSKKIKI